jgi:uncharacterized membrane protein YhaH (DUF805 family)
MSDGMPAMEAIAVLVILALVPISVFNAVKRLHDLGRSGWWLVAILAVFVPIAALMEPAWFPPPLVMIGVLLEVIFVVGYLIVLGAIPGQAKPNRFGPPPGRQVDVEAFT